MQPGHCVAGESTARRSWTWRPSRMASQTEAGEVRGPRAGPISETADLHVGYQTTDSSGNAGRRSDLHGHDRVAVKEQRERPSAITLQFREDDMVLEPLQRGADAPAVYLAGHPPRRMLLSQHVPARVVIKILGHSQ